MFELPGDVTTLFVDLTNFYTRFVKSGLLEPELLRTYFSEWFDFSQLATFLTGKPSDTWIFHSDSKLGPPEAKIDGDYLQRLISRFDAQPGVTTQNVNISGQQREPYAVKCSECGAESDAIWKSEKGIDSSLIVHLFDTMEYWDQAFLLSGDADFVPAVRSLRRRGKIVKGAGFQSQAAPALIRECFTFNDLTSFFKQDLSLFSLIARQLPRYFTDYIRKEPFLGNDGKATTEEFEFHIQSYYSYQSEQLSVKLFCHLVDIKAALNEAPPMLIDNHPNNDSMRFELDSEMYAAIQERLRTAAALYGLDFSTYQSLGESQSCTLSGSAKWKEEENRFVFRQ